MAISLPIPCYLIETGVSYDVSVNKDVFRVGGETGNESSLVVSPNKTKAVISLKYQGLSDADTRTVEAAFKDTAGVTRISYENKNYRLSDGYEVEYFNGLTNINFTLHQVA